ncbi:uncharacterized protein LOC135378191 [Ornithodoros turicata]|uniref:uncharacterized protein LOC135378191 n=1 Tax=Ornithodoros turicata TaxID=34597 RepID=UPI003139632A
MWYDCASETGMPKPDKCDRAREGVRSLSAVAKNVVCNVYLYFSHQREMYLRVLNGNDVTCACSICKIVLPCVSNPWSSLPFRATELATNVRKRHIFRIAKRKDDSLQEFITPERGSAPTFAERQQVREALSQFFDQKKHWLRSMKFALKNGYPEGRFGYVLESLGFVFRRWNDVMVPIEQCSLIAKRARYLRDVQEARGRGTLFFLDMCWLDDKHVVAHRPEDCICPSAAVLFAGSNASGTAPTFEIVPSPGDVRGSLCSWVRNLAEKLPARSIVVITDFTWMTDPTEKLPSEISPKQEIIQWLEQHSTPYDRTSSRYELLELVLEQEAKLCAPQLQSIMESAGHSVLFLPSNVLELNPVSLVWQYLERSLKKNSSADPETLLSHINEDIWYQFYLSAVDLEEAYRNADGTMFHALERMPVNTDAYRDETLV